MNERRDTGLRDILTILFKHKQKIIITFLAVVIVITAGTFLITPTYEAKSSLLVKFGREYLYTPEVGEGRPTPMTISQEELLNSEVQILLNRDIIEKVLTSLGPKNLYPDLTTFRGVAKLDAAVDEFKRNLTAEAVKRSNVIQISYQHANPELSAKAVNLLVDHFRDKHLQIYADPKSSFMAEQLTTYRTRLKEAEEKLEAFKQSNKIFSLDEQRGMLLRQRMDADTADKDAENRISEITKKIESLKGQMHATPVHVPITSEKERSRTADEADSQLLALRLREQQLLEKYREDNRLVVNVKKEIALLEDYLKRQKAGDKIVKGKNAVYEEMEKEMARAKTELASLHARRTSLSHHITALDGDIRILDSKGSGLSALKREVALNEKNYQTYLERTEEARISDTMNRQKMANVTVIQPATVPTAPIKPRKGYNFILALVLGSISGLGLAFFSEYAGQSLSTPETAEKRLSLPVIGSVQNKG